MSKRIIDTRPLSRAHVRIKVYEYFDVRRLLLRKLSLLRCEVALRRSGGDPPSPSNGIAKRNRLFLAGEFPCTSEAIPIFENSSFWSARARARADPILQSRLVETFPPRTLLVRKRLKCPARIEADATTRSVESFSADYWLTLETWNVFDVR